MMIAARGTTILLADDESSIRTLIESALSAEGYRLFAARNGFEVLRVFEEQGAAIDLVITEMRMPYLGGSELISALQAARPSLKCLCITAYAVDRDLGLPVLAKPFSR